MINAGPRRPESPTGDPWQFEERQPWELGFADHFRDWVAPELARIGSAGSAGERRYRRRIELLLGGGIVLIVLIAEASGSLPITLIWAALLVIIGGALAHAPVAASRAQALNAVRDRVIGFYGLSPLPMRRQLQRELRASGLWTNRAPVAWAEQYWGIYRGTPVRLAQLRRELGGSAVPEPAISKPTPMRHGLLADRDRRPDHAPNALVLLLETGNARSTPCVTHNRGRASKWPGEGERRSQDEWTDARADLDSSETAGVDVLANALGGAPFDLVCYEDRLLILAHADLPALDWARLAEGLERPGAASLERPMRALLESLYRLLSAAHALANAGLPCETCQEAADKPSIEQR